MLKMTARELKNRTSEALRAVAGGGRVMVTMYGRPHAVLVGVAEATASPGVDADQVFADIRRVFENDPLPFTWEEHRAWRNRGRLSSSTPAPLSSRPGSRRTRARR